jgi:hypothetical protein
VANSNNRLRNAKNFKELDATVILTVKTKCPEKWLLLDRETGQIFQGSSVGHWDRLDAVIGDSK